MKDTFYKTLAACSAAVVFGLGAFTVGSQLVHQVDSRVEAILAAQAQKSTSGTAADADSRP